MTCNVKKCWFFSFARSKLWKLVNFGTFCAKKLFKDFISFICRIREVQFSELGKGIYHLSAARRQIGRKTAVFWSGKSQGILFLHEGGYPVKIYVGHWPIYHGPLSLPYIIVIDLNYLYTSKSTGPDSSVGRVSAPGNGRSRVRSRAVTYQSR